MMLLSRQTQIVGCIPSTVIAIKLCLSLSPVILRDLLRLPGPCVGAQHLVETQCVQPADLNENHISSFLCRCLLF